jgi:hypothetical protein
MFCFVNELVLTNDSTWLAGNKQAKVHFENKESQAKGETTVLENSVHPSQQSSSNSLVLQIACTSSLATLFPSFSLQLEDQL